MDYVRTLVSGNKRRFIEGKYNLDLTYITSRIIAMSFPADGWSRLYRNSADTVAQFLEERHGQNYRVFNLSEYTYDQSKFQNHVSKYPWPDHHSPPLELLFRACWEIHEFLISDQSHVVVVNCMAGKGRTGTLISCYLLFSGRFATEEQALLYYKRRRFTEESENGGVSQPSQLRYVQYFFQTLSRRYKYPTLKILKSISLQRAPHFSGNSCVPFIKLFRQDSLIYSSKTPSRDSQAVFEDDWSSMRSHTITPEIYVFGDILCHIRHRTRMMNKSICRVGFNPTFTDSSGLLAMQRNELDPYELRHDSRIASDFAVYFYFEDGCFTCTTFTEPEDRCKVCAHFLSTDLAEWHMIQCIIDLREKNLMDPSWLLFRTPEDDDVERVLTANELEHDSEFEFFDYVSNE
jgi:phosphatidylinositol-3,4,5-trisphosphate 3-phosphatase/dual-specificity protein phosphatase PTEN